MQLVAYGAQDRPLISNRRPHCSCCSPDAKQVWFTDDLITAVRDKHYDCLKRASTRSARRTDLDQEFLCQAAAREGKEMLAFVHTKMRMKWDHRTVLEAFLKRDKSCFEYALQHGAPLNDTVFIMVAGSPDDMYVRTLRAIRKITAEPSEGVFRSSSQGKHVVSCTRVIRSCGATRVS